MPCAWQSGRDFVSDTSPVSAETHADVVTGSVPLEAAGAAFTDVLPMVPMNVTRARGSVRIWWSAQSSNSTNSLLIDIC